LSAYPCWLTENGCPGGITTRNVNPDDWPFGKCKGEGKGWNARENKMNAERMKPCPAYAYFKGLSDEVMPWMYEFREVGLKDGSHTEDEIRGWAKYYMGLGPKPGTEEEKTDERETHHG